MVLHQCKCVEDTKHPVEEAYIDKQAERMRAKSQISATVLPMLGW